MKVACQVLYFFINNNNFETSSRILRKYYKEMNEMENNKIISALSYFSVLFFGVIFPIIVYFVVEDEEVKRHAKRAFFSHIVPLITVPFVIWSIVLGITGHESSVPFVLIPTLLVCFLLDLVVFVWNIIQGIKVLKEKNWLEG